MSSLMCRGTDGTLRLTDYRKDTAKSSQTAVFPAHQSFDEYVSATAVLEFASVVLLNDIM